MGQGFRDGGRCERRLTTITAFPVQQALVTLVTCDVTGRPWQRGNRTGLQVHVVHGQGGRLAKELLRLPEVDPWVRGCWHCFDHLTSEVCSDNDMDMILFMSGDDWETPSEGRPPLTHRNIRSVESGTAAQLFERTYATNCHNCFSILASCVQRAPSRRSFSWNADP